MSIINDALKKAEKNKQLSSQIFSKGVKLKTTRRTSKSLPLWVMVAVVFVLVIFVAINSYIKNSVDSTFVQETISLPQVASSDFSMRKAEVEVPFRTANFRLSGILFDAQQPLAIINSRIVAEGALINGAEVIKIQPTSVQLSSQGKEFIIKIK